ncbi:MAG TPA: hypothetical protein VM389_12125 [Phycisphaerae bacterium]|nr:hypothetical protein [Phycisphaerae bacterium]HUU59769.1 hypothetical protein [Phycisphaerae bacterium]
MPANTIYVIYNDSDGAILRACFGDAAVPPVPGSGEGVLDAGMLDDMPTAKTHRVDLGGPTLVAKTSQEQQDAADTVRKKLLARAIGEKSACRAEMDARNYPVAEIDAEIAALEAEYDAIP